MAFVMTMDLIVIAFIGCFLAAGMCSGLILNICRKLRQDKIELDEIRVILTYLFFNHQPYHTHHRLLFLKTIKAIFICEKLCLKIKMV